MFKGATEFETCNSTGKSNTTLFLGLHAFNFKRIAEKNPMFFSCSKINCTFGDITHQYKLALENLNAIQKFSCNNIYTHSLSPISLREKITTHYNTVEKLIELCIELSNALSIHIEGIDTLEHYGDMSIHSFVLNNPLVLNNDKKCFTHSFALFPLRRKAEFSMLNDKITTPNSVARKLFSESYEELRAIGILINSILSSFEICR